MAGKERRNVYQEVTDRIVSAMEKGVGEWRQSWKNLGREGLPVNGLTGRFYRGVNIWLLLLSGFGDRRWYTFDQAKQAVGYVKNPAWERGSREPKWIWPGEGDDPWLGVKKGEKGTQIVFWKFIKRVEENDAGEKTTRTIPLLRTFTVFNASQISGLPSVDLVPSVDPAAKYAHAQELVDRLNPRLFHDSDKAFYSPPRDEIHMPAVAQFESVENYWSVLFHEIGHWTGHESRLKRDFSGRFGSEAYAAEELVAELTAAFMCGSLAIEGDLRHPEYLATWIKVLKNDPYAIFTAASKAQKAADFMLSGVLAQSDVEEESNDQDSDEAGAEAA